MTHGSMQVATTRAFVARRGAALLVAVVAMWLTPPADIVATVKGTEIPCAGEQSVFAPLEPSRDAPPIPPPCRPVRLPTRGPETVAPADA